MPNLQEPKIISGNANRALSHGCIRTERALELAMTMAILGKGATRDEAVEIALQLNAS